VTALLRIDHVQLAMPKGAEEDARRFYSRVLGMVEVEKPSLLAGRGGVWFAQGDVQIHLGVEEDFRPARKAHPAIRVADGGRLRETLAKAGFPVREDDAIHGVSRFYTDDCFGNRIEFIDGAGT
jgi:catechol 2,3-dioxygenase-like lactoylglutathione lyase family enzyme